MAFDFIFYFVTMKTLYLREEILFIQFVPTHDYSL